jgi:CelD/BcsL family acetyltransferase involved in cellulose biosynthesis
VDELSITDPTWAEFVRGHGHATPFHEPGWAQLLGDCYSMKVLVLAQRSADGSIMAGTPLAVAPRLPGTPRRLVSLPFTDAIRPLAAPTDEEAFAKAADEFREAGGFARLELRGPLTGATPAVTDAVRHTLVLASDPDEMLARFSQGKRRNIRTAERQALRVRRAESERDVTETFYRLHVDTRRRLGVPVQPRRFFRLLWQRVLLPDAGGGFALIVDDAEGPVAGAIFLRSHGQLVYKFGASHAERRRVQLPNDLLFWHAIREACIEGLALLDFGRSDLVSEGLREFKRRWGADEEPLVYSFLGTPPRASAAGTTGLLAPVLKHSPHFLTRGLGELLYRYAA